MAPEREDWKKKLKALGVGRKRKKRKEKVLPEGKKTGVAPRLASGRGGEEAAALHLLRNGLLILDRNVRYADGELDIVAEDAGTLVFVEVKRRASVFLGAPGEAVGPVKRRRVVRASLRWLAAHPRRGRAVRFDVVALVDEPPSVTWVKDAFDRDARA